MISRRWCLALGLLLSWKAWSGVPESEFKERRARLLALADSDAVLVFHAATTQTRSGDVTYPYRQESNLLYLTGAEQQNVILLLYPHGIRLDGKQTSIVFFCPGPVANSLKERGSLSDAVIESPEKFQELFTAVLGTAGTLLVSGTNLPFVDDWMTNRPMFLETESRKLLQEQHPGLKVKNAGPLVAQLRACKSPSEIELISDAIRITGDGISRAAPLCKDGAKEYELQAAIEYDMVRQGASGPAFPSIVGSGPNSLVLHYDLNRRTMHDGEVVVLDVGAEYDGYSADVTRTLPVSGTFTDAQKKVYSAVLQTQKAVLAIIRPGVRWSDLDARAREIVAAAGFKNQLKHPVSHHLGLDTHDPGAMDVLKEGMVITVEPGIYVAESDTSIAPQYRGIGVRIEDDVFVGKDGAVVLSAGVPREIDAVEALMRGPR